MRRLPTDIKILDQIYKQYSNEFSYGKERRLTPNYVPINVAEIAKALRADGDVVFSRLYYSLERKYAYRTDEGSAGKTADAHIVSRPAMVHFFAFEIGDGENKERHCINFPYMAGVLADLRQERFRYRWTMRLSVIAIVLASVSAAGPVIGLLWSS